MKKTITSRLEVLLAKIAGKDASLETMTPGVPINLSEKLMLDIADRLDSIAENTPPKVTATDNGDVLTVVDGAWAKAAPSGGGSDLYIVNVTWDDSISPDGGYAADKTYAEITAAMSDGKIVAINDAGTYSVALATMAMGGTYIYWDEMIVASSGGSGHVLMVSHMTMDGNGITETRYKATLTAM